MNEIYDWLCWYGPNSAPSAALSHLLPLRSKTTTILWNSFNNPSGNCAFIIHIRKFDPRPCSATTSCSCIAIILRVFVSPFLLLIVFYIFASSSRPSSLHGTPSIMALCYSLFKFVNFDDITWWFRCCWETFAYHHHSLLAKLSTERAEACLLILLSLLFLVSFHIFPSGMLKLL